MVVNHVLSPQFRLNFDDWYIYRDVSSNLRMVVAAVHFLKFEKYIHKLFCNVAVKPLATFYIVFALKFIYEASNNLFPVVVCDFKTPSSADPTMNAD